MRNEIFLSHKMRCKFATSVNFYYLCTTKADVA